MKNNIYTYECIRCFIYFNGTSDIYNIFQDMVGWNLGNVNMNQADRKEFDMIHGKMDDIKKTLMI